VSKAFTRESDDLSGEEFPPLRPQVPPGAKRHITKAGAERLRQQANALLEEKRALVSGDSHVEHNAVDRVRRIDADIQRIQLILDSVIVPEPPTDARKAGFGAFVQVLDQTGDAETYQIVGPDEADPNQGRISSISPLARALMNHLPGDSVQFNSPAGEQKLTILALHY